MMAQHKYEMLTVPVASDAPKRHHPWYKERLRLKFINTSKHAAALDGQKWTFVANDIDDFRSGVPSKTKGKHMKLQQPEPKIISNNPGLRTLYSKVGSRQQVQRERLERETLTILNHPLKLNPYLEDCIPVELLDSVLDILEPELANNPDTCTNKERLSTICDSVSESDLSSQAELDEPDKNSDMFLSISSPDKEQGPSQQSKLYRFPLKQTKEEKEREKVMAASQQVISASQQSRVDQVTHDLVQWMVDLGGSEENKDGIDESTIKSLFGSDYESRPAQVAPVHVVEFVNVPPELRLQSRGNSHSSYSSISSMRYAPEAQYQYGGMRMRGATYPGMTPNEPRYVRSKYGAWYLPVDLWRVREENEPLSNPKVKATESVTEDKAKTMDMDRILMNLHGAKHFKEFILTKKRGSKLPSFLEGVNISHFQTQR